jgi:glutaredoxin 3
MSYTEIDVSGSKDLRKAMTKCAGSCGTVPQVFIDGIHTGGYDDV